MTFETEPSEPSIDAALAQMVTSSPEKVGTAFAAENAFHELGRAVTGLALDTMNRLGTQIPPLIPLENL